MLGEIISGVSKDFLDGQGKSGKRRGAGVVDGSGGCGPRARVDALTAAPPPRAVAPAGGAPGQDSAAGVRAAGSEAVQCEGEVPRGRHQVRGCVAPGPGGRADVHPPEAVVYVRKFAEGDPKPGRSENAHLHADLMVGSASQAKGL